ncbi:galactose mutarotase-like protein [Tothia fuscella]|uniref:Glucose-6-phosphate 1-epimerase n=1 Tax=Tothia fuscella TaxID=1048955 RepID=A0A9P4TSG2_9PEZI|nr:galactose mutarotase-like protein [Tothia fuscella]
MVDRSHKPSAISAKAAGPQPTVDVSDNGVTAKLPTGESVEVLLHGASVISWKSKGEVENLWLSESAVLDGSKPVRGGIPVVFPNFGPAPKDHATSKNPQHGFARNVRWEFLGKSTSEGEASKGSDDSVKLDFGLYSTALSDEARKAWPYDFGLVYSVTLSQEGLRTVLNVRNEGKEAFEFQVLLHTYLRVKDISKTTINGLASATYSDKVLSLPTATQSTPTLSINGEVDRVYKSLAQDTTSVLEGGKPRFDVVRDNLVDTVVWNPWIEKAKGMGDFSPKDGYKNMLCVEVGAVDGWQKLDGGEGWEGGQVIRSLL